LVRKSQPILLLLNRWLFAPLCLFAFGFGYFATTIHAVWRNVVWAVYFTCCAIY